MQDKPQTPSTSFNDIAVTASIYAGTTIASSPFIALAMLAKNLKVNEGVPLTSAITNPTNIYRSLNPQVWGRAASRRLIAGPTIGESVRIASETFKELSPIERTIIYSALSVAIGSTEAFLTTGTEAAQVLRSRGALPSSLELKKITRAALPATVVRNTFPVASLFAAKEVIKAIEEQNGGQPISKTVATAIGICLGAIAGALSLPADVMANIAIKTGKRPTANEVAVRGPFLGGAGRAMQLGCNIGSIMIAGLIREAVLSPHEQSDSDKKPPTITSAGTIAKKASPPNVWESLIAGQERRGKDGF